MLASPSTSTPSIDPPGRVSTSPPSIHEDEEEASKSKCSILCCLSRLLPIAYYDSKSKEYKLRLTNVAYNLGTPAKKKRKTRSRSSTRTTINNALSNITNSPNKTKNDKKRKSATTDENQYTEDQSTNNDDENENQSTEDQSTTNDEDKKETHLDCVCRKDHGAFWVQCDGCDNWHYVAEQCVGFSRDGAKLLDTWNCWACNTEYNPRQLSNDTKPINNMYTKFFGGYLASVNGSSSTNGNGNSTDDNGTTDGNGTDGNGTDGNGTDDNVPFIPTEQAYIYRTDGDGDCALHAIGRATGRTAVELRTIVAEGLRRRLGEDPTYGAILLRDARYSNDADVYNARTRRELQREARGESDEEEEKVEEGEEDEPTSQNYPTNVAAYINTMSTRYKHVGDQELKNLSQDLGITIRVYTLHGANFERIQAWDCDDGDIVVNLYHTLNHFDLIENESTSDNMTIEEYEHRFDEPADMPSNWWSKYTSVPELLYYWGIDTSLQDRLNSRPTAEDVRKVGGSAPHNRHYGGIGTWGRHEDDITKVIVGHYPPIGKLATHLLGVMWCVVASSYPYDPTINIFFVAMANVISMAFSIPLDIVLPVMFGTAVWIDFMPFEFNGNLMSNKDKTDAGKKEYNDYIRLKKALGNRMALLLSELTHVLPNVRVFMFVGEHARQFYFDHPGMLDKAMVPQDVEDGWIDMVHPSVPATHKALLQWGEAYTKVIRKGTAQVMDVPVPSSNIPNWMKNTAFTKLQNEEKKRDNNSKGNKLYWAKPENRDKRKKLWKNKPKEEMKKFRDNQKKKRHESLGRANDPTIRFKCGKEGEKAGLPVGVVCGHEIETVYPKNTKKTLACEACTSRRPVTQAKHSIVKSDSRASTKGWKRCGCADCSRVEPTENLVENTSPLFWESEHEDPINCTCSYCLPLNPNRDETAVDDSAVDPPPDPVPSRTRSSRRANNRVVYAVDESNNESEDEFDDDGSDSDP